MNQNHAIAVIYTDELMQSLVNKSGYILKRQQESYIG